jgi:hypothetical protein
MKKTKMELSMSIDDLGEEQGHGGRKISERFADAISTPHQRLGWPVARQRKSE